MSRKNKHGSVTSNDLTRTTVRAWSTVTPSAGATVGSESQ